MTRHEAEQAIAADLDLCDLGMAMTKGATRRKYVAHRTACMAQIRQWNVEDGLGEMTAAEILAELTA